MTARTTAAPSVLNPIRAFRRAPASRKRRVAGLLLVALLTLAISACASSSAPASSQSTPVAGNRLKVVATTTIVGDVVRNIGGDAIDLTVMLPAGADPHGFEPAPTDIASVNRANAVFINGLQLESFLTAMVENAGGDAKIVAVSDGITPIEGTEEHADEANHDEQEAHGSSDPHTWTDPNNVIVWVDNIERTLSELDPADAGTFAANAAAYKAELQALDKWIREEVATIPEANRKLVTDHAVFGYFANRYGFQQTGAVIPGYSTLSEPSAQEIAGLEDTLRSLAVNAIFVGNTVNNALSQRVADDTGVRIVPVYTGSLSEADGPAATYLDYMRYNVNAFVSALAN